MIAQEANLMEMKSVEVRRILKLSFNFSWETNDKSVECLPNPEMSKMSTILKDEVST